MAIIQEYMSGPCKIIVHDDYITKDPEEVKKIIQRVSKLVIDEDFRRFVEEKNRQKIEPV